MLFSTFRMMLLWSERKKEEEEEEEKEKERKESFSRVRLRG